jgi:aminodeoxyfutalosine deaminase
MLLRAQWVLDRELKIAEPSSLQVGVDSTVVDLGDSILMPGLVNAHCHLDYTEMQGKLANDKGFIEWIREINQLKRQWNESDYVRSITRGLEDSLQRGTTTMANWICSSAAIDGVEACPMRVWWFLEQIAFRAPITSCESWEGWPEQLRKKTDLWKAGLAPHAPYTCPAKEVSKASRWSEEHRLPWSIHVAETDEEFKMFQNADGTMYSAFKDWGRDMEDCGGVTPLGLIGEVLKANRSPALLVHGNYLEASDLELLAKVSENASIVHCPRSHAYFRREIFPFQDLISRKVNVCLGTDSLASNEDLSMFREMAQFARKHPEVNARSILTMATINGAQALGVLKDWQLWEDWVAIPVGKIKKEEVWETIVHFQGKPQFVMVDGKLAASSSDLQIPENT